MASYPFPYEDVRALTVEQLFRLLDDWLNSNSFSDGDANLFDGCLRSTHRTLQQLMVGMFWKILVNYGTDQNYFDGRNESAVNLCKSLNEKVQREELPKYLPFI